MGGGAVRQHHLERASISRTCNACFLAADNFWAANAAEISEACLPSRTQLER